MVGGNRPPSLYLFCTILVYIFAGDSVVVLSDPGYILEHHAEASKTVESGNDAGPEQYPFGNVYYSYNVQSNKLVKNAQLDPPIDYKIPKEYILVLEPIAHYCNVSDHNIFKKFSVISKDDKVYIEVDENLTNILTSDSTIVYKLKAVYHADPDVIGGETNILIRIVQRFPVSDTVLNFEEKVYSLYRTYGRKGVVYSFKARKTGIKEQDGYLEYEKQPKSDDHFSANEYPFTGKYALEYVPEHLLPNIRIDGKNGTLEIIGNIDEGPYSFDVVAADFGPNSTTVLTARAKVDLFVDNVAVCNSMTSSFIKAFSKHSIEENKLQTVSGLETRSHPNCSFAISNQHPFGEGMDFFDIDPETGKVHTKMTIDRESYPFEDMEEPSVYLRIRLFCPPLSAPLEIKQLNMSEIDNIVYDPSATIVQVVILDVNDNQPGFPDKHMTVGYPVSEVAHAIVPRHLIQVKATDKDAGKNTKIKYSLRGDDADYFVINPETGTVYCKRPVDDSKEIKTFEVVAKDNEGLLEPNESVLAVTVKYLTFENIVRVNVPFIPAEDDHSVIEMQLSDISGLRVMSLTNDVITNFGDDGWKTERTLIVYGVNNTEGSMVPGSYLKKLLEHVSEYHTFLKISSLPTEPIKYSTTTTDKSSTAMSVVYAALFCLMLSAVAMGLLYFGYVKNGRYLSCIASTSTTPLKDDMENMSQSNWITTFNRSNLSSSRTRYPGKTGSPASRSKTVDHGTATVVLENSKYEAIPPKGNVSVDSTSITKLDSSFTFDEHPLKLELTFTPTDEKSFNF